MEQKGEGKGQEIRETESIQVTRKKMKSLINLVV